MLSQCIGPNCSKPVQANDLCSGHNKQRERGKELTEIVKHLSSEERFLRYINKTDTCWLWKKSRTSNGYGQFKIPGDSSRVYAHRYSYEIFYKIKLNPDDILDHRCRNRKCVNPEHLDLVSQSDNVKRMLAYKSLVAEVDRLRELLISNNIDPGPHKFKVIYTIT